MMTTCGAFEAFLERVGPHYKASDRQFKTLDEKKMIDGASP